MIYKAKWLRESWNDVIHIQPGAQELLIMEMKINDKKCFLLTDRLSYSTLLRDVVMFQISVVSCIVQSLTDIQ